ncbi:MAG: TolC family protein [Cytophagaceae bacterium]|nr:TolC family protein [Cytophagaceae bacterium]
MKRIILALSALFYAQTGSAQRLLTLQAALQTGQQQSLLLQSATLDVQQQQALRRTAFDLPRTNVDVQYGRIQTFRNNDYTVGLVQTFAWPGLYRAQAELFNRNVGLSQNRLRLSRVELASGIKQVYYQLLVDQRRLELLLSQDTLYQTAARAATIRYQTGETNRLEQVSAQARLRAIRNRANSLRLDISSQYQTLSALLNSSDSLKIDVEIPLKRPLPPDSVRWENNPLLSLLRQQTAVSGQLTLVERQRLKPDLRVGVLNQSIETRHNQNVVQAGVGLPIFAGAQKARIAAATLGEQAARSQLAYTTRQLSGQRAVLVQQIEKYRGSLTYYESTALPQADLILDTALKSYRAGDIEYVEFFQSVQQAWQLRENYLSEIEQYNQVVIELETLLGYEN